MSKDSEYAPGVAKEKKIKDFRSSLEIRQVTD